MKLVGSRFLRGPNIHRSEPCYVALLDLQALDGVVPAELPGFSDELEALLPVTGVASGDVADAAQLVARLAVALQALAGSPVGFADAVRLAAPPRQHRVVCGYVHEAVVEGAVALAVDLVAALAERQPFDPRPAQGELRARVAARAIDARSTALLAAARMRDIPVLRLDDDARRFQLGWGVHRREHVAGAPGDEADVEVPPLDTLVPGGGNGRIPVVAVTGTNGKTTTTLLIAHAVRASGACTGTTTTQGVFIDGRCIETGDCTGYWSARKVLTNCAVEVATLETARGGLLKRGLAFDRCDVGVVLNVSSDHLGLDGVETLADLARVKGLVARCAARAAVLNAEDDWCVGMRETLRPGCEPVLFAMSAQQPVLQAHLAAGGRGACLDDGWLVWCDSGRRERVVEAATLPFTLQGRARYNIANALAALAALRCLGHQPAQVATALASFVSDARTNPLRANQFEVGGVRLIVDYAHNVVAYRALCETARALLGGDGRLIGVVTSPGDRRAADLDETGRVCGAGFDELVVYEQDPRGRGAGETTRALLAGARCAAPAKPLHGEPDIRRALVHGLHAARPGDVLVFTCAGTFDDLVEGVRLVDADAADRIAREIAA